MKDAYCEIYKLKNSCLSILYKMHFPMPQGT